MSTGAETPHTNPFPGLRPFRDDEEHLFFGRESQVDAMVDKLAATRFLAVVGTSGSGKSSLVNCGLRPALHGGLMVSAGTAWRIAQFRPGSDPIGEMARELARKGVLFRDYQAGGLTLAEIVETNLRMSKLGLVDIVEQARLGEGVKLLVVVDQFEELFRYRQLRAVGGAKDTGTIEEATAFVNLLLEAAAQATVPIYVVLTMRSDFLGDAAQFPGLAEAINAGQYLVPRMTRDQRRAAIKGPVSVGGAEILPVLLTRLVNDVGDNPDQLSILQHALNRTWAYWENEDAGKGPLGLVHYQAIGSMAHALDRHADKAYAELGSERQRQICEKIFKALTDKVADPRGIRRPTKFATLCELADATAAEVIEVIDVFRKLSRSFLMPPVVDTLATDTVIDISHESLMRVWKRLNTWADEEAQSARTYRRLAETAALHAAGKSSLLRDRDLAHALEWEERQAPNATWAAHYAAGFDEASAFLRDSEAAHTAVLEEEHRRAEAKRRAKERELEQAKALAEAQRQRADEQAAASIRQRRLSWGLAAILLLALGAAGFGWEMKISAEKEAAKAEKMQQLGGYYQQALTSVTPNGDASGTRGIYIPALQKVIAFYQREKNSRAEYSTLVFVVGHMLQNDDKSPSTTKLARESIKRAQEVSQKIGSLAPWEEAYLFDLELGVQPHFRGGADSELPAWRKDFESLAQNAARAHWASSKEDGLEQFNDMAIRFFYQEQFEKSELIHKAVADVYRAEKMNDRVIDQYMRIARIYLVAEQIATRNDSLEWDEKAKSYYKKAVDLLREAQLGPGFDTELLVYIGLEYLRSLNSKRARKYFDLIEKVPGATDHSKAMAFNRIAEIYAGTGSNNLQDEYKGKATAQNQEDARVSVSLVASTEPYTQFGEWCCLRPPDSPMANPTVRPDSLKPTSAEPDDQVWAGEYSSLSSDHRNEAPFALRIRVAKDGKLTGQTIEPATFGDFGSPFLYASVKGTLEGNRIQFVKKYDGTGGQSHEVCYQGEIERGGRRLIGRYTVGTPPSRSDGLFVLERKN